MFKHFLHPRNTKAFAPYLVSRAEPSQPQRKQKPLAECNNSFVKPIKQSFVRNARLMPMTRCMVLLLVGWSGHEQAIETTIGTIAKKLGRSTRQVHRYLRDAIEEGYLFYSRTKDRQGYYTGVKIFLNFGALKPLKTSKKLDKTAEIQDMTQESDTNIKDKYKRAKTPPENQFLERLERIAERNDIKLIPI